MLQSKIGKTRKTFIIKLKVKESSLKKKRIKKVLHKELDKIIQKLRKKLVED